MNVRIDSVDHAPDDLYSQVPLRGRLLRTIAKHDRSDRFRTASADYWLAELDTPLSWTRDGATRMIRHLVLAARWEGTSLQPGATLPVGIAYVLDDALLSSESFDLTQAEYIAIGMAKVSAARSLLHESIPTQVTPAVVGLLVAWGGTALLVSPVVRGVTNSSSLLSQILGQLALWLLFATIIAIVVAWERQPVASLWVRPFQWQTIAWAGVLIVVSVLVLFPVTEWVRTAAALPGYAKGMETALAYPLWLRVFAVITAGVVEETLFRGYAVTRVLQLTGSTLLAIGVSSAAFAALHLSVWGAGPSLGFFIGGLVTTTFFVWRRDLAAMIMAHVALDMWGIVISPGLSRWWD